MADRSDAETLQLYKSSVTDRPLESDTFGRNLAAVLVGIVALIGVVALIGWLIFGRTSPPPTTDLVASDRQVVGDATYDLSTGEFEVKVAGGTCTKGDPVTISGSVRLKAIEPPGGVFVIHRWESSLIDDPVDPVTGECPVPSGAPFSDRASLDAEHPFDDAVRGQRLASLQMARQLSQGFDAPVWRVEVTLVDLENGLEVTTASDLFPIVYIESA